MLLKILTLFVIFFTCTFSSIANDNVIANNNGQGVAQHSIALQTPAGQIHVKVDDNGELVGYAGIPNEVVNALQSVVWELVVQGKLPIEGGVDKVPSTYRKMTGFKNNDWHVINNFVNQHVQKFQKQKQHNQLPSSGEKNQLPINGDVIQVDAHQMINSRSGLDPNNVNLMLPDGMESVHVPMYFKSVPLSSARIMAEVDYYIKHNRVWSQRVVLEKFYYGILGENANSSKSSGKDVMSLQLQGKEQFYNPTFNLSNWTTNDDVCTWEGITCHNTDIVELVDGLIQNVTNNRRVRVRQSKNCWCIVKKKVEEWRWADDSNQGGQDCECPGDRLPKVKAPLNAVTKIELPNFNLVGGRLSAPFHHMPFLTHLDLSGNRFITHIPTEFGLLSSLHVLDLSDNDILGSIPSEISNLGQNLQEVKFRNAGIEGMIPEFLYHMDLKHLDLGGNNLHGPISSKISLLSNLRILHFGENVLSGTLPKEIVTLNQLEYLDLGENYLTGTLPHDFWRSYSEMRQLILGPNKLSGTFSLDEFGMTKINHFNIGRNEIGGKLDGDWSLFPYLSVINLNVNEFEGHLPTNIFLRGLKELNVADNYMTGPLPTVDTSRLSEIRLFDFSGNFFTGTLPSWLIGMNSLKKLRVAQNRYVIITAMKSFLSFLAQMYSFIISMTGHIDERLCSHTETSDSISIQCTDFVACPPTYVHPQGAASLMMGCSRCKTCLDDDIDSIPASCEYFGQSECDDKIHFDLHFDTDGDGNLTQRDILRLIYVKAGGKHWGSSFSSWDDISVETCHLAGINCKEGRVTKIDLRGANICQNEDDDCSGLPSEIGLLEDSLEVLDLSTSIAQKKRLRIPSEIGLLMNLKILDLSRNRLRPLPWELGSCYQLVILGLAQADLDVIPYSIWSMTRLEKLDLSQNNLRSSTLPSEIGYLTDLRELFLSRSHLKGTIPSELGNLSMLKNLELYGNALTGSIPSTLSKLTDLKRIDVFNNKLTGNIDVLMEIKMLEILHLKANAFSGTFPNEIGSLSKLSWIDITTNRFQGQLPSSLADLNVLRDFKVGSNLFQPPIPIQICRSKNINKGFASEVSCGTIVCPLGTVSASGHASTESDCIRCPVGQTSLYLGSSKCKQVSEFDFLELLYNALNGDDWSHEMKDKWDLKNPDPCDWDLVECDDSGQIESLEIPLSGMEQNEKLFESRISGY